MHTLSPGTTSWREFAFNIAGADATAIIAAFATGRLGREATLTTPCPSTACAGAACAWELTAGAEAGCRNVSGALGGKKEERLVGSVHLHGFSAATVNGWHACLHHPFAIGSTLRWFPRVVAFNV